MAKNHELVKMDVKIQHKMLLYDAFSNAHIAVSSYIELIFDKSRQTLHKNMRKANFKNIPNATIIFAIIGQYSQWLDEFDNPHNIKLKAA